MNIFDSVILVNKMEHLLGGRSEKNDEVFFFFKAVFDVSQTEELSTQK